MKKKLPNAGVAFGKWMDSEYNGTIPGTDVNMAEDAWHAAYALIAPYTENVALPSSYEWDEARKAYIDDNPHNNITAGVVWAAAEEFVNNYTHNNDPYEYAVPCMSDKRRATHERLIDGTWKPFCQDCINNSVGIVTIRRIQPRKDTIEWHAHKLGCPVDQIRTGLATYIGGVKYKTVWNSYYNALVTEYDGIE